MEIQCVLETCLYVDDLAAAESFYGDVLGLEFFSRQEDRHVFFRCGRQMLLLFDPRASAQLDGDLPPHGALGAGHVAFSTTEDALDRWQHQLVRSGVDIERVIDWPQGGKSIYFRDPAGNSVELATPRIWFGEW